MIEVVPPIRMVVSVKWLKLIAVVGFLVTYLGASNHCRLELLPGLDFLACEADGTPTQEKDCEADGCADLESGFYKVEDLQPSKTAPPLNARAILPPLLVQPVRPAPASHISINLAPPELSAAWQFALRAVAPPRAPSLAS